MRRFLVGFLAVVGALGLLLVAGAVAAAVYLARAQPEMPERVVLTLDLRDAPSEVASADPLARIGLRHRLSQSEILLTLNRAARDPRVAGLYARLDGDGPGLAQIQELRDAVAALREQGKFALAFADSFGELGPGTSGYYLATAFDEVHLQPLGFLGLIGLRIETPLARELLDELGVAFDLETRGEYKSLAETFTRSDLSPAHREMLESLADDVAAQLARGIAAGRGKGEAEVRALIDDGPYVADEALANGLVDALSYRDDVADAALARAGAGATLLSLADYADRLEPEEAEPGATVALVYGAGRIVRGDGDGAPPIGGLLMGADTVADALRGAIDDPGIEAILLRIDSGGGSAVASEAIGRQVRRAVAAGKPVVVSMGNAAASGGYWIAMGASHIVAAPATLTGSIGVVAGKPVLDRLWDRLGVSWGTVQRGANASMFSLNEPYDPAGRARLQAFLDATYGAFVAGVAEGRDMPEAAVHEIARGRVWTGERALELGLVDELGGLPRAVEVTREILGLDPDAPLALRVFPPPRGPFEQLLDLLPPRFGAVAPFEAVVERLRPGVLSAPPLVLR
ncbi:MAG TPA: signal peptide peptidase SppA [Geminicoccaceae bacterium]|nr:signal peptide peptidase SppA [Geminicoccaceae bacterium]